MTAFLYLLMTIILLVVVTSKETIVIGILGCIFIALGIIIDKLDKIIKENKHV